MYISETVGWICSIIGLSFGWLYLKVLNYNSEDITLTFSSFWVVFGISLIVIGCGLLTIIAALEKWNKYQEKRDIKKFEKFEKEHKE